MVRHFVIPKTDVSTCAEIFRLSWYIYIDRRCWYGTPYDTHTMERILAVKVLMLWFLIIQKVY